MWIGTVLLVIGMIAGYFIGYRHGSVAGELAALKIRLHRSDNGHSRRRSRGGHEEVESKHASSS